MSISQDMERCYQDFRSRAAGVEFQRQDFMRMFNDELDIERERRGNRMSARDVYERTLVAFDQPMIDEPDDVCGLAHVLATYRPFAVWMMLIRWCQDEAGGHESNRKWTRAYINRLADSAFLYIEPGGTKDEEGKTKPRYLRHFPYKDIAGHVNVPHLKDALSRIPQSDVSQRAKDEARRKAERIYEQHGGYRR